MYPVDAMSTAVTAGVAGRARAMLQAAVFVAGRMTLGAGWVPPPD